MKNLIDLLGKLRHISVPGRIIAIIVAVLLLVLNLFFSSCSGYRSVSLNVDKPEKVTFNMSDSITSRVSK